MVHSVLQIICLYCCVFPFSSCASIIEENFYVLVKNSENSPENYGETFSTNLTSNVVTLNFQTPSMLTVTEVSVFSHDIRFWRVIAPGEIALGEPAFQTLCFLSRLGETDLLPTESIAKLRQKKPKLVRFGDTDKGDEQIVFTMLVSLAIVPDSIKQIARSLCHSTTFNGVFVNEEDFRTLFDDGHNGNVVQLSTWTLPRCNSVTDVKKICQCELKVKIAWYPCGWQYCSNTDSGTPTQLSQICGIKSCRAKRTFYYEVDKRLYCGWDN